MEPEIVELARRMRETYFDSFTDWPETPFEWSEEDIEERLAWVAAAAVARPDLVPVDVPRESWLYPIFGDTKMREPGCRCDQEEGDSPCPVHPSEDQ